jgi:hypothetical protein
LSIACALGCSSDDGKTGMTPMATVGLPNSGAGAGATAGTGSLVNGTAGTTSPQPGAAGSTGTAGTGMTTGGGPAPSGGAPAVGGNGAGGMAAVTGGNGGSDMPRTPRGDSTCLEPGNGMYTEQGPYQVGQMDIDLGMIQEMQNSGKFTIFYPMPLEDGCPHPIVAWGNGTTVMGSGTYAFFNTNAASWGMVVAASHEDNTGSGNFHKAGIDWLLAQNEDSSSMFYQKLSTRAGVSGHSQGGFGSSRAFSHPNVETAVIVGASAVASDKVSVLILTGTEDIASGAGASVGSARGPMFFASWEGGDHVGTETIAGYLSRDPGTMQMQRLYAAWFRCFLADDPVACAMLEGGTPDGCGICGDSGWAELNSSML